jgi:hypothetical protein
MKTRYTFTAEELRALYFKGRASEEYGLDAAEAQANFVQIVNELETNVFETEEFLHEVDEQIDEANDEGDLD